MRAVLTVKGNIKEEIKSETHAIYQVSAQTRKIRLMITPATLHAYQRDYKTFSKHRNLLIEIDPNKLTESNVQHALIQTRFHNDVLRKTLQKDNFISHQEMSVMLFDYEYHTEWGMTEHELKEDMEQQAVESIKAELRETEAFLIHNVDHLHLLTFFHTQNFYTSIDDAIIGAIRYAIDTEGTQDEE